jgi:hypothetical protein
MVPSVLRQEKLWGLDHPLFPATKIKIGDSRHFEAAGLDRMALAAAGCVLACPRLETRVLQHFQKRMAYGLFVPDAP